MLSLHTGSAYRLKELGGMKGDITGSVSVQLLSRRDWNDLPLEKELASDKSMMINIMDVRTSEMY